MLKKFFFYSVATLHFCILGRPSNNKNIETCEKGSSSKERQTRPRNTSNDECTPPWGSPGRAGGRPIQYVHVPKTGGASVQGFLREVARNYSIRVQYHDGPFVAPKSWDQSSCIVFGHRPFGWEVGFSSRQPFYVVTLRDPVALAVSLFDYVVSHKYKIHDQLRDSFGKESFSVNVIRRNENLLKFVTAYQAEYLIGIEPCMHDVAVCALNNLERADCVGIAEELDQLLLQFQWATGWLGVGSTHFPRANAIAPGLKSAVTLKARSILEDAARNNADDLVYRRAREISTVLTLRAKRCLAEI